MVGQFLGWWYNGWIDSQLSIQCLGGFSVEDTIGCFAENFGWVWVSSSLFPNKKSIPTHEKNIYGGKQWPKKPLLTWFFFGWGGLGVGSSSVSLSYLHVFQPNIILVNRKHPNGRVVSQLRIQWLGSFSAEDTMVGYFFSWGYSGWVFFQLRMQWLGIFSAEDTMVG